MGYRDLLLTVDDGTDSAARARLASRLAASWSAHLTAVAFVNSGSEANDVAWRMAKAWTKKQGGLCMDFAYHGITEAIDAHRMPRTPPSAQEGTSPGGGGSGYRSR